MELNNNNNNTNTNSNRAEWKIQLIIKNDFISVKDFEDIWTVYLAGKPAEIFMGSYTENIIYTLFNTILNRIQQAMETTNERGTGFTHDSVGLLYYYFQRIDIRRGRSYIVSPDWIASKKATINSKNEKDNEGFRWSIIAALNYNKINEKELKKLLKVIRVDTDFSSYQRDWEEFEQENTSIALNILFLSHNSEEVKLAYKSIYNKHKNQVILLMINDEANNCYYFAVKNLLELNSSGWLRAKKEVIINNNNNNNNFEETLDDALNYQNIEIHPGRISKLKPYINKYNWEGIDFPAGPKEWIKFEKNNKTIALNVLYIPHNTKTISITYRSEYNNKHKKQVILLMINQGKNCHYLAVANLSALFNRISSNHDGDFYCLNCFNP